LAYACAYAHGTNANSLERIDAQRLQEVKH